MGENKVGGQSYDSVQKFVVVFKVTLAGTQVGKQLGREVAQLIREISQQFHTHAQAIE